MMPIPPGYERIHCPILPPLSGRDFTGHPALTQAPTPSEVILVTRQDPTTDSIHIIEADGLRVNCTLSLRDFNHWRGNMKELAEWLTTNFRTIESRIYQPPHE